jgi:hypothetical protein
LLKGIVPTLVSCRLLLKPNACLSFAGFYLKVLFISYLKKQTIAHMKKIYTLVTCLLFSIGVVSAQCTPDTSTSFFSPVPSSLPCIDSSEAYNQFLSIYVWDSVNLETYLPAFIDSPVWIHIDSMIIDSIGGLPIGLTDSINPSNGHLYPQTHNCILFSGTTHDTIGTYKLSFFGTIYFYSNGYGTYLPVGYDSVPFTEFEFSSQNPFTASLHVVEPGGTCTAGINNFSADLNSSMSVYPNPNNGKFDVQINAGRRVNGEILVMDITGRTVYTQQLDIIGLYSNSIDLGKCAKGIYTLQLRTPEGFASKKISIE